MGFRTRAESRAAWICALYATTTFAWYGVWRNCFAERSADEGIFENILWNGVHGHGLRSWAEGGVSHFAVHLSPVLYLLLPPYALFRSMHVVHLAAAVLTAFAGYQFHGHVARTLDSRSAQPLLLAFLLCPTIVLQTFMEFHEQAFAILPLTLLLISWSDGRRAWVMGSALALLMVREDNAFLLVALGVVSLPDARRRATGGMLLALGLCWLALWQVISVHVVGRGHLPDTLGNTYAAWGESPGQIVRSVIARPLDVVRHVMAPVPLKYLALLLAPVLGVLPFGSPLALVMLPQLCMVLLADPGSRLFQIRMHYSVAPAVVLLFAAVATLRRIGPARPGFGAFARRWAPAAMMAVVLLLAPGWAIRAIARLNPFSPQIREILSALPDTASVSAPGYLLNHLAARPRFALAWYENLPNTDYVVLEDSSRFFLTGTTVDVFYTPHFDSLLAAGGYSSVMARHGWHVYRRRAPGAVPRTHS